MIKTWVVGIVASIFAAALGFLPSLGGADGGAFVLFLVGAVMAQGAIFCILAHAAWSAVGRPPTLNRKPLITWGLVFPPLFTVAFTITGLLSGWISPCNAATPLPWTVALLVGAPCLITSLVVGTTTGSVPILAFGVLWSAAIAGLAGLLHEGPFGPLQWLGPLFFAGFGGLICAGAFAHHQRARSGHCNSCGYSLAGLTSDRCPECGVSVASLASDAAAQQQ